MNRRAYDSFSDRFIQSICRREPSVLSVRLFVLLRRQTEHTASRLAYRLLFVGWLVLACSGQYSQRPLRLSVWHCWWKVVLVVRSRAVHDLCPCPVWWTLRVLDGRTQGCRRHSGRHSGRHHHLRQNNEWFLRTYYKMWIYPAEWTENLQWEEFCLSPWGQSYANKHESGVVNEFPFQIRNTDARLLSSATFQSWYASVLQYLLGPVLMHNLG